MNDATLTAAVTTALQETGYFHPAQIDVSVAQGVVALRGEIEWDFQKRTALFAAKTLPGVTGVIDKIVLRFSQPSFSSPHVHRLAHTRPEALSATP